MDNERDSTTALEIQRERENNDLVFFMNNFAKMYSTNNSTQHINNPIFHEIPHHFISEDK